MGNLEGYIMNIIVNFDWVEIIGNLVGGVFNGIQFFFSLLVFGGIIFIMIIIDELRFRYRGLLLDLVRNFFFKLIVIKVLEVMVFFKFNKFQLNLVDDEGW